MLSSTWHTQLPLGLSEFHLVNASSTKLVPAPFHFKTKGTLPHAAPRPSTVHVIKHHLKTRLPILTPYINIFILPQFLWTQNYLIVFIIKCLPNRVCFRPKMVCFCFVCVFVFCFFSQDLSRGVLSHTICVLCSCTVKRICKVFTLTHARLDLQETSQRQCECQLTSRCSAARLERSCR